MAAKKEKQAQLVVLTDGQAPATGSAISEDFRAKRAAVQLHAQVQAEKKRPQILKGCFIATAAMGSELDPHVSYLRNFRDSIVLRSRYRVAFEKILNFYYSFSPPIANSINGIRALQLTVRYGVVYPLVFGLKAFVRLFNSASEMKDDASK